MPSGIVNLDMTGRDIVTAALRKIRVINPRQTLSDNLLSQGLIALNNMLGTWDTINMGLWLEGEARLLLQKDTIEYDIGPGGNITSSLTSTALASDASSGASSISVDSATGFTNGDEDSVCLSQTPAAASYLTLNGSAVSNSVATTTTASKVSITSDGDDSGVSFVVYGKNQYDAPIDETITGPNATTVLSVNRFKEVNSISISGAGTGNITVGFSGAYVAVKLDDGSLQFTQVEGTIAGTTIPLADSLTDDAAEDNTVFTYTNKIHRPIDVTECRYRLSTGHERPVRIVKRDKYMRITDKTSTGETTQVYYQPTLTNGKLFVWPEPTNVSDTLKMTCKYPVEIFNEAGDDVHFPREWNEALVYSLAVRLSPDFGKPVDRDVRFDSSLILKAVRRHEVPAGTGDFVYEHEDG